MAEGMAGGTQVLVVGTGIHACAVPLSQVIETMRPLPVDVIAGVPSFISGISIIRGVPTPVVDLQVLLGMPSRANARFVTIRLGARQVALSVEAVVGIRELDPSTTQKLPPLLQGAPQDAVDAIGTLDEQLLLVLQTGWQLPDEVWRVVAAGEEAQ